jgi:ferrous iron transport protein B
MKCAGISSACKSCPAAQPAAKIPESDPREAAFTLALAGNPNTGKSTVFNWFTGLHQHTGNWPGKTISRAEGRFRYEENNFRMVDLPGTYSLLSASPDEEVARNFILFGKPDVTIVVMDATALERNLNLALQIRQLTSRMVICLNLMDEAKAHGLDIDVQKLAAEMSAPVIPCSARSGVGMEELRAACTSIALESSDRKPPPALLEADDRPEPLRRLGDWLEQEWPDLPHREWVAMRLLTGDDALADALKEGSLGSAKQDHAASGIEELENPNREADQLRCEKLMTLVKELAWQMPANSHDVLIEKIYVRSAGIHSRCVSGGENSPRAKWQRGLDRWLTHPVTGFPLMFLIFALVLWLTIEGANVPSAFLSGILLDTFHPWLRESALNIGLPTWLVGISIDGMYLACAWVVSVMLPPMAIFFPLFTLLEDLGYLPRIAFNLDRIFQKVGAHGKQALTMSMGLGCNAAGVIACRIIDSPRERLIAIITNNFALCNGRWPTQILLAGIFIGVLAPEEWSGLVATLAVATVAILGFILTFISSYILSKTVLKGEASSFSLELPPFRPPQLLQTLYRSLIDRTLFVLWRAVVFALPAGAVIWLLANFQVGGHPIALWLTQGLDPVGTFMGMSGIILLAYIVAIPANEIVIPTILMLHVALYGLTGVGDGAGVLFEPGAATIQEILVAGGWTGLTACSVMLFSLCHNPCSTTIYTIYKETGSIRWTAFSTLMPLGLGIILCSGLAFFWRFF